MTELTARPAGPAREDFAGDSVLATARRLFHATRPKFFSASVLPVLAGTTWGVAASGRFELLPVLLAIAAIVFVNAGSNVLNDVGDDASGTDRDNPDRIYPYTGGSQFIQAGILDRAAMLRLGIGLLVAAVLAGLALIVLKGPVILAFGLAGILLGVLYSVGPLRLSAIGLGELAIAIACGLLPVTGSAWLQGGVIDTPLLLFSVPIGAWVAAILLVNEVPDIAADGAAGKRTLPVRLGCGRTAILYLGLQLLAPTVVLGLALAGPLPLAAAIVPAALILPAWRASAAIRRGLGDRAGLTRAIEATIFIHAAGTAWLAACALFGDFSLP
ncbi:MAG: 1,4-dihydroxy-2-naphthoate octaprenyltransferase [Gammaproteobacteria bacterium]|nr:1,4-dihydroxy-2-naphthoate octaprenyltransferase [Gammaproteobacteria bacterium]MDH4255632.1 1,4-dihydroxy-2-naphthoate octaprenyltransferase [Gammaproteobacteria bacterium]MDH5311166.1 1,4-dihydroxy-2-naphthoate octaprenyltransferase [Gammaproteobacteria bacterium]